ncbi:galactoside 2-alpha-L-fucosyltransferase [Ditylenchus destructor]|uniref:Galactoside 2-alpha-L-fucosyltransferase n=1 Tax=Ditylenchus destructor TaxID=166010 RepID=A0AAD4RCS3_9BILA|nr:galactoside 2-alpha-L-fucosyltransferase [Ditylenchus destructor]
MYVPISMSRTEDMAFASIHCDSLLITAQASTFGWWIGYLMDSNWDRSRGSIFFNSNFKDDAPSDTYGFDNFPSHWIPLRLVPSKIVVEDRLRPISE